MVDCCGLDVIKFYTGGNHKYALDPILKRTKEEIAPLASTRQLRRWFRFYVENGRTKAEVRLQKKTKHDYRRRVVYNLHKHKKRGIWSKQDTLYLRNMIKYMPHLYVFEITKRMRILSGVRWSQSYVYKNLRKLGWSLQVVFERAR